MSPRHLPGSRPLAAAATTLALALVLAACGGSDSGKPRTEKDTEVAATPTSQVTGTPAADAEVLKVTLTGGTVDPNGKELEVERNQPVVLQITADKAGELHVHSTPEQHVAFPAGDSEITLKFDQPGVVDVEDHALDKLIVQLEVS